ncbi:MAG TPA: 6-phosphogluconolactonase [Ohtaekwangia sp.]
MNHIFKTPDELLVSLADLIVKQAEAATQKQGRFSFVLSGGSSPKKLFELLASDSYRNKIDWSHVYFFFGDERNVPADHADSNYLMAKKALFDALNIAEDHIFRMKTELGPAEAAANYQQSVLYYFGDKPVQFDFVLLGLGDDAHTASLFPHTTVLKEKTAVVKEVYVDKLNTYRITLTEPCINKAKQVVFLVYGGGKAEAIHHVQKGNSNPETYPAQLINPASGELHWFMDEAAATKLS